MRNGDTPVVGLVVAALLGTGAVAASAAPRLGAQFGVLIEASTALALLSYAAACVAATRGAGLRRGALAWTGAAFCAAAVASASPRVLAATALGSAAIWLAWPLVSRRRRRAGASALAARRRPPA